MGFFQWILGYTAPYKREMLRSGNIAKVRRALWLGVSDSDISYALTHIIATGRTDLIDELLKEETDKKLKNINTYGRTLLMDAVFWGNGYVVKYFLDKGADVNGANGSGETPVFIAALSGKECVFDLLVENGACIDMQSVDSTPLICALRRRNMGIAKKILRLGGQINLPALNGDLPLVQSIRSCSVDDVRFLIDAGADIQAEQKDGLTPLLMAIQENRPQTITLLIDMKADVNKLNSKGMFPLMVAIQKRDLTLITELIASGADVNMQGIRGWTPLIRAIQLKRPDFVEVLIQAGADVNLPDDDGNTPIMHAVMSRQTAVAEMLIIAKADVNASNKKGETPLIVVAKKNLPMFFDLLMNAGADTEKMDKDGCSALYYVAAFQMSETLTNNRLRVGQHKNVDPIIVCGTDGVKGVSQAGRGRQTRQYG